MIRTKCEICGKVMMQLAFLEIDVCDECEHEFHLQETDFGLRTAKC